MKKMLKRLCTGFLALATVVTALPTTPVHAESKQYWTESSERVGIIEKVMNDGSIGSTFNEGYMKVEGETAYCIDINTDFKNGYKTRADASSRMSADQISDKGQTITFKEKPEVPEEPEKPETPPTPENPKLYGRGYAIGDMGHTDYVLVADDIVAFEEK